jgi:hypothetical protein
VEVTIQRTAGDAVSAVQGTLTVSNDFGLKFHCLTIERPDKLITAGTYTLSYTKSPRFSKKAGKDVYTPEIHQVDGRAGLRIHPANYFRDLEGCIAVGRRYADLDKDGSTDISESKLAYDALVACLLTGGIRESDFRITIRDAYRLRVGK